MNTDATSPSASTLRRSRRLRSLRNVLLGVVGGYVLILGLLVIFEEAIIFPAPKYPLGDWNSPRLNHEEVLFQAEDGVKLHGWYVAPPQPRAYVLFCHGNGENVGFLGPYLAFLRDELQVAVFAFDYRGYGRSEGKPDEAGILADGRAAHAWLAEKAGGSPEDVVLWGRSVGGAVAVDLAAENGAKALILERTFTSLPDVAAYHYPWAPVHWLMRTRLDSAGKINRYDGPLLQSHGSADTIVPYELGRRLFETYEGPKEFLTIEGGDHNDPPAPRWHGKIDEFLERLPKNAPRKAQDSPTSRE